MAETKGTDPKSTPPKSGAVKPPVLDLKAREAEKPAAAADLPPKDPPPRPGPAPKPAEPVATGNGFPIVATLAGGVLGLAAAYGLALAGLWPTPPVTPAPADPRLAQFATAIPELETVTQTTQGELAALNQRIGALETASPAAAPDGASLDLSGVEADIAALAQRLDQVSATPAGAGDPAEISALRTELVGLGTRLDELGARLGTAEAELRTLDTTVTQTTATLADQPTDIGAVLQLPLILSGLEAAFASGRPYEAELAALRSALPQTPVPTIIANGALSGLARPDVIASRFDAALPALLASQPGNPDAQWQDGALDWFGAMIALRPTGEQEGDAPQAVVSRLEGAIARRDFAAAETLVNQLPEAMRTVAGDLPALIGAQAEAGRFLDALRAQALAGGGAS